MKTVTFKSVLEAVAGKLGLHPHSTNSLTSEERQDIVDLLNVRLKECWEWTWWPELMRTEARTVLEDAETGQKYVLLDTTAWDAGTTYAAGDVRERFGHYYEASQASTGQDPATATSYWTEVDQTPIGTVLRVSRANPEVSAYPGEMNFIAKDDRLALPDANTPDEVWIQFLIRAPEMAGVDWDASIGTYVAGNVRYYDTTGECYRCVQTPPGGTLPTDAAYWMKIDFPTCLKQPVLNLTAADGRDVDETAAERLESKGYSKLSDAEDVELLQQGQVVTAKWRA